MDTVDASSIATEQIDTLEKFAQNDAVGPELRDVLLSLSRCLRDGSNLLIGNAEAELTPSQVAERLRMSRTHLYKLLDRGEIPSVRVGRDRRIRVIDLMDFEARRQRDRRRLAEAFATEDALTEGAIEKLADTL